MIQSLIFYIVLILYDLLHKVKIFAAMILIDLNHHGVSNVGTNLLLLIRAKNNDNQLGQDGEYILYLCYCVRYGRI